MPHAGEALGTETFERKRGGGWGYLRYGLVGRDRGAVRTGGIGGVSILSGAEKMTHAQYATQRSRVDIFQSPPLIILQCLPRPCSIPSSLSIPWFHPPPPSLSRVPFINVFISLSSFSSSSNSLSSPRRVHFPSFHKSPFHIITPHPPSCKTLTLYSLNSPHTALMPSSLLSLSINIPRSHLPVPAIDRCRKIHNTK